ncbi:uncharacterized protein LOC135707623 [Ochlerotatus camptorhynchus]|uniref:uncharacterized protein LOC135707623 n=1 Tax=Ochlerotatus camptorhynchus TaxID=644619 RepID=UPI0031DFCFD9
MQMDPKKNGTSKKRQLVISLRKQVDELKSEWMRLEGDRIQLAVRHTDLMCHWNSISGTYAGALRHRNETIQRLLKEAGITDPSASEQNLINEKDLRDVAFQTTDKGEQTELW